MKGNNKITTKEFWSSAFENASKTLANNDPIKNWIGDVLDFSSINNCIEIGCYPGKYLTIFGEKGVEINGLDYIDDVVNLKDFYSKMYKVGEFTKADVLEYETTTKYDCVMSFGLIEHFLNWEELIGKHINYVDYGGYLILEVPNFKGWLQKIPRFLFDRTNFNIHNLKAMDLEKWEKIFLENGFSIIDKRYFGGYEIWYENNTISRPLEFARAKTELFLYIIKKVLYPTTQNSKNFSAYMGIIVKKNND